MQDILRHLPETCRDLDLFYGHAFVVLSLVFERRVDQSNGRRKCETATFGVSEIFSGNLNNLGEMGIFTINPGFSRKSKIKGKMRLIRE